MPEFLEYRVLDAMTPNPVTIAPEISLAEAEAVFETNDFNALPVVDEEGRLAGIFTRLDLLEAFREIDGRMFVPYEQIMKQPVSAFMTEARKVVSVTPRTPLTKVLEKLVALGTKSLPVVDNEQAVGIISREDLMRALRRALAGEAPEARI